MFLFNKNKIINLYNDLYYKTRDFCYCDVEKLEYYDIEELIKTYMSRLYNELKELFLYELLSSRYINKYDFQTELQEQYFNKKGKILKEEHNSAIEEVKYYISILSVLKASLYEIIKKIIK